MKKNSKQRNKKGKLCQIQILRSKDQTAPFFLFLMAEQRMVTPSPTPSSSTEDSDGSLRLKWQNYFGKSFSVFEVEGEKYLLGVQMASLLRRETYNVYRSLKIKKIAMQRATAAEVSILGAIIFLVCH
jgi:hypothetical protein